MAKNFLEKTVRFNIQRKPALADSLLPYKIYINGQYVGALKNGRTISAEVPRAEIYYIDDGSFEQNAVIRNENKAEYNLVLTTLIISKKPGNTGISRDIRTEFTTDLLLSD